MFFSVHRTDRVAVVFLTEPNPGYHGLVYHDARSCCLYSKVRIEGLRDYGAALSFNAFQIIQGLETLSIRVKNTVKRISFSTMVRVAGEVACKLSRLKSSKYYDLAQEYLPKGQNGLVTLV
jgi:O-acetylhomoserine (thiol)-lyase